MIIAVTMITIITITTIMTITIMSIAVTMTITTTIITTMITARTAPVAATIMNHDHHHHHADEVFSSWGKETPHKYSEEQLREILTRLSDDDECGIILRAKGILPCTDGTWLHFDMVPEEFEVRHGEADYTGRLCVIGSHLNEEELAKVFGLTE